MNRIKALFENILDFILPKSKSIKYIESLSTSELIEILPKANPNDDDNLIIVFNYKNQLVREMIWELKYNGNKIVAEKFAKIIIDILIYELSEKIMFESAKWQYPLPLLIPIPTSKERRRIRGWNPTEILGRELEKIDENKNFIYSPKALNKIHHTDSQARTHATKRDRMKNLINTMKADKNQIDGRCVILLDDVTTSGATFKEASRAIKEAGAEKIIRFAVAR